MMRRIGALTTCSGGTRRKPFLTKGALVVVVVILAAIVAVEAAFITNNHGHHLGGASVRRTPQLHVSTSTRPTTRSIYNQTDDDSSTIANSDNGVSYESTISSTSSSSSSSSSSSTTVFMVPHSLSTERADGGGDGTDGGIGSTTSTTTPGASDSDELKILLDEAVLLYMSWTRTATATSAGTSTKSTQALQGLIQDLSYAISSSTYTTTTTTKDTMDQEQLEITTSSTSTIGESMTTVQQAAKKVEEALGLFMQGKITKEEMEQVTKQYKTIQEQEQEDEQEEQEQEEPDTAIGQEESSTTDDSSSTTGAREVEEALELFMQGKITKQEMEQVAQAYKNIQQEEQEQLEEQQQQEQEETTTTTTTTNTDDANTLLLLKSFRERLQALKKDPPPHTTVPVVQPTTATTTTTTTSATTEEETNSSPSFGNRIKNGMKNLFANKVVVLGGAGAGRNGHHQHQEEDHNKNGKASHDNNNDKKVFPKLIFSNNDKPNPIQVQDLLDQATMLFASTFTSTTTSTATALRQQQQREEAEDLIEEIGHVLYYSRQSDEIVPIDVATTAAAAKEEEEEEKETTTTDDHEQRSPTQIAQELEAALQLHMTMGDDLSKEIVEELAEEYKKITTTTTTTAVNTTAASTSSSSSAQTTTTTTTPPRTMKTTIPLEDPGSVEVSSKAIMESLQERITSLQQQQQQQQQQVGVDEDNGFQQRKRRSSIWEAVATGYTERTENGFHVSPPPGGETSNNNQEDTIRRRTEQRKRNGRKSKYDASSSNVDDGTKTEDEEEQYIDAVILEGLEEDLLQQHNELDATSMDAAAQTQQQQQQQPKDNAIDANILPDKAITIPFNMQDMFWNKVNMQGSIANMEEEEGTPVEEVRDTTTGKDVLDEPTTATKSKEAVESNQRALLAERLGLESTIREAVRSSILEVNQRAILEQRLEQEAHSKEIERAEKLQQEERVRTQKLESDQRSLLVEQLLQEEQTRKILQEKMLQEEELARAEKLESNQRSLLVEQLLQEEQTRKILQEKMLQEEELARAEKLESNQRALLGEYLRQDEQAREILRANKLEQEKRARAEKLESNQRSLLVQQLLQNEQTRKILQEKMLQEEELARAEKLESNQRSLLVEQLQQKEHARGMLREQVNQVIADELFDDCASVEDVVGTHEIKDEFDFFMEEAASKVTADLPSLDSTSEEEDIDAQVQEALDAAESAINFASTQPVEEKKERRGKVMQKMAGTMLDLTMRGAFGIASRLLDKDKTQEAAPKDPTPPSTPPPLPFFARTVKAKVQGLGTEGYLSSLGESSAEDTVETDSILEVRQPLDDDEDQSSVSNLLQVDSSSVETLPVAEDTLDADDELPRSEPNVSVHQMDSADTTAAPQASTGSALDTKKIMKAPHSVASSTKVPTKPQSLEAKRKDELTARALMERRLAQPASTTELPGKDSRAKPVTETQDLVAKQKAELSARALMERRLAQPAPSTVESSDDLPSTRTPVDEEVVADANVEKRNAQAIARSLLAKPPTSDDGVVGIQPDSFGPSADFGDSGMQEDPLDKLLKASNRMASPVAGSSSTTTGWTGYNGGDKAKTKSSTGVSTSSIMAEAELDPPVNDTGDNEEGVASVLPSDTLNFVEDKQDITTPLDSTDQAINAEESGAAGKPVTGLAQETAELGEDKIDISASVQQKVDSGDQKAEGVVGLVADDVRFTDDRKDTTLKDIYGSPVQGSSVSDVHGPLKIPKLDTSFIPTPHSDDARPTLKEIYQKPKGQKMQSDRRIGTTNLNVGKDVRTPLKEIYGQKKLERKNTAGVTPEGTTSNENAPAEAFAEDEKDNKKNENDDDDDESPPPGSSMNHPVSFFDMREAWVTGGGGGDRFSVRAGATATQGLFRSTEKQFKEGLRCFMGYMRRSGLYRILMERALRKPIGSSIGGGNSQRAAATSSQFDDDPMRRKNHIATATALHFHPNSSAALELPPRQQQRYRQQRRSRNPINKKQKELYMGVSVAVAALTYPILLRMIGPSVVFLLSVFIPHCYLLLRNSNR